MRSTTPLLLAGALPLQAVLAVGTAALEDAGALPPLVRLLDSPELEVQQRAVMALTGRGQDMSAYIEMR